RTRRTGSVNIRRQQTACGSGNNDCCQNWRGNDRRECACHCFGTALIDFGSPQNFRDTRLCFAVQPAVAATMADRAVAVATAEPAAVVASVAFAVEFANAELAVSVAVAVVVVANAELAVSVAVVAVATAELAVSVAVAVVAVATAELAVSVVVAGARFPVASLRCAVRTHWPKRRKSMPSI